MDLHLIEVIAHSLLSGGLDNLNDNFESLNKSQLILLTRLDSIEAHLNQLSQQVDATAVPEARVQQMLMRIKAIRKRIKLASKTLAKVEKRLDKLDS
ncbi:hypothetical protein DIURU_000423 [Diutina rugosa]|uniref:Biogenesis of lysosome-related organelles complex 1 subunit 7 n=1 Tax=Diutina rugosa TaxID=5481 RepID=A0A642V318_DIURU|nr:uncharacterized protein DIURU_000423 [Diutina rugosa]KAA8907736.1 hypothetical protein DIURU_000423 [Diutina rugosa]